MSDDVLVRFLENRLINVGGDDAKLEKLRAAAGDLGKIVLQMPAKATSFALIAFDPDAPADDPAIREVGEVLKAQWKTYANAFPETPVTVFRAMLLEALCQAAADDDRIGAVFVALARNLLPVTEGGNEQVIWAEVVSEVERRINPDSSRDFFVSRNRLNLAPGTGLGLPFSGSRRRPKQRPKPSLDIIAPMTTIG